jgi:hypothetical protein
MGAIKVKEKSRLNDEARQFVSWVDWISEA